MNIAVTDNMGSEEKLQRYVDWLKHGDPSINIIKLSYLENNLAQLEDCAGVVLTGGGDVDPRLYGGDVQNPKLYGVDGKRDDFERKVIDYAVRHETPLLGICRGLQIANVHLGGSLVADLATAGHPGHEGVNGNGQRHKITLQENTTISRIAQSIIGEINSYHHQAADQPGAGLHITGYSDDNVAEVIEPLPGTIRSFFLLVQWHPERMWTDGNDATNPLCKSILESFLAANIENEIRNQ